MDARRVLFVSMQQHAAKRARFTFDCFGASRRVETKLPNEVWMIIVDFLIGAYVKIDAEVDTERTDNPLSCERNPIGVSIVPELHQINTLRLTCHDLYDAVARCSHSHTVSSLLLLATCLPSHPISSLTYLLSSLL